MPEKPLPVTIQIMHPDEQPVGATEKLIVKLLRDAGFDIRVTGGFCFYRVRGKAEYLTTIEIEVKADD